MHVCERLSTDEPQATGVVNPIYLTHSRNGDPAASRLSAAFLFLF